MKKPFDSPIFHTRPHFPPLNEFIETIKKIYKSKILTNQGHYVQTLEKKLEELLGIRNVLLINNATTGLLLLLREIIGNKDGEVIVPAFTFPATAHVISFLRLTPVFCDINYETLTIGEEEVKGLINENTRAIIGVNIFGRPCDFASLHQLSQNIDLPIIYDSAHCFGSSYQEKPYGCHGLAEVFSFHATKNFSTLEGGAITTNNDTLAQSIKKLRNFGFEGIDSVGGIGINAKLNEISAAFGLASLPTLVSRISRNKELTKIYEKELDSREDISFIKEIPYHLSNYHFLPILTKKRDFLYKKLRRNNIMVRRYFYPGCHKIEPYISRLQLKNTDKICDEILCLPLYPDLQEGDIIIICNMIKGILG